RRERMDEGVHVGGVQIVLLVPTCRRQYHVRVQAGGGHAEVERRQQIEPPLGGLITPADFLRPLLPSLAKVLALQAMLRSAQVLEEILVTLARGAQQILAPHDKT